MQDAQLKFDSSIAGQESAGREPGSPSGIMQSAPILGGTGLHSWRRDVRPRATARSTPRSMCG